MKKLLGILCLLMLTNVSFAELRIRTALKSARNAAQTKVTASSFSESDSTNLNYYPVDQGSSVQWMNTGLEVSAVNSAGQLVHAEFRITAGSFSLYRNGVKVFKTDMTIFIPPNGRGTPSIALYDKLEARITTKDYQSILTSFTASRFVLSDHKFAIGIGQPAFQSLDNAAGSSYVIGYSLMGEYKPEGATQFTPFSIIPGDQILPKVDNTFRNYAAIVVGGMTIDEWMKSTTQVVQLTPDGARYVLNRPLQNEQQFPGSHFLVGGETSVDLKTWSPISMNSIDLNTWASVYFNEPRRFFKANIGTYTLFGEG